MAPRFWHRPPGPLLRAIGPLAPGRRRHATPPARLGVKTVAVGSLSAGGTGKTPAVIALAQRLALRGRAVQVVTGGRGAPRQVEPRSDGPEAVGDEPLLIAAFAPTWVAADLVAGARAAAGAGAEVVIVDGGFPARLIAADLTLVVEDATRGFGNGFALPLGPLKRPLSTLHPSDVVLTIGPPGAQAGFARQWGARLPGAHLTGHLAPLPTGMDWAGLDVVAFAGIGAPERFFATLRALGANLVEARALSDHQELTEPLLARLEARARATGAQLVTTEKDAVRLPRAFRQKVISLPVRLELDDWAKLDQRLP